MSFEQFGITNASLVFDEDSQGYTALLNGSPVFVKVVACKHREFKEEVERFEIASRAKLAPVLYESIYNKGKGILIMEQLAETLERAMKNLVADVIDVSSFKSALHQIIKWDKKIFEMCEKSISLGIPHTDLHAGNIMFSQTGKLYFIDYEARADEPECEPFKFTKMFLGTFVLMSRRADIVELAKNYLRKL